MRLSGLGASRDRDRVELLKRIVFDVFILLMERRLCNRSESAKGEVGSSDGVVVRQRIYGVGVLVVLLIGGGRRLIQRLGELREQWRAAGGAHGQAAGFILVRLVVVGGATEARAAGWARGAPPAS
jgi:hypothetical protein